MTRITALFVIALLILAPGQRPAAAQDAPVERPRYTVTIPPGFVMVEVSGIKAICEPADRQSIETTLATLQPTTRPSTMPSELITRLTAARADVVKQLAADYALADTKTIETHLDKLAVDLKAIADFRPPLFYLCTTDTKLKSMLKGGDWTTPGIYYNRLADDVMYRETVPLTIERPMDDTIVAVIIESGQGQEALQAKLQKLVTSTRSEIDRMLEGRGLFLVQATFIDAAMHEVIEPMKLPLDQQWLGVGLSGVTSADYAAAVTGSPRRELLVLIAAELRRNPIRMSTIDLLHPADATAIKRQYVAAYADAYRRKSMRAVIKIVESRREKMPVLISSLREKPCASGAELLKRIEEVTELDLRDLVKAE